MNFLHTTNTTRTNRTQNPKQHVRPRPLFLVLQTLMYILAGYVPVVVVLAVYLERLIGGGPASIALLVLVPVLAFVKPFAILAVILAIVLLIRLRSRSALITLVIVVMLTSIPMVYFYRYVQSDGQLTANQAVRAIENCTVESVTKASDSSVFLAVHHKGSDAADSQVKSADAAGYGQYVAAAKKANPTCIQKGLEDIVYTNNVLTESNDPTWPGNRWTTKEDAIAKIRNCSFDHVQTFTMGYEQAYAKGAVKHIPGSVGSYAIVEPATGAFVHGSVIVFGGNNPDTGQFIQLTQDLQARCGRT